MPGTPGSPTSPQSPTSPTSPTSPMSQSGALSPASAPGKMELKAGGGGSLSLFFGFFWEGEGLVKWEWFGLCGGLE